jgi:pentatricopeptide repeat protein
MIYSVLDLFDNVLGCSENQGSFDRALALVEEMDKAGVKPDINTYRHLIFACSLNRDEAKAHQVNISLSLLKLFILCSA